MINTFKELTFKELQQPILDRQILILSTREL